MNDRPAITVILPTHNPHPARLRHTLSALAAQTLPPAHWECLLVDNASYPALRIADWTGHGPAGLRIATEPEPGLSHARRRGFDEARGDLAVLVDDDNVLAPDYLATVLELFSAHPHTGALGGKSLPGFETPPPAWATEFFSLLALRDPGPAPLSASLARHPDHGRWHYPECSPIGAGMALRRQAWEAWLKTASPLTDRRGGELTSGGDNDIVLTVLHAGWRVGYFPQLSLTHLIPVGRLSSDYLARLNRGIQKSWMQVLLRHDACPWPTIPRWTLPLRKTKAWFSYRAWTSPAARIRWQGACGHFEGRAQTMP